MMLMWKRKSGDAHTPRPGGEADSSTTTRITRAFRLPPLRVALAALALPLLALALIAPAGADGVDDLRPPDLGDCQDLQVRAGNKVVFHAFGVGVQIYRWDGTSWIFVAPEAV